MQTAPSASIAFDDIHVSPAWDNNVMCCAEPPPYAYKPVICVGVAQSAVSAVFLPQERTARERQLRMAILGLVPPPAVELEANVRRPHDAEVAQPRAVNVACQTCEAAPSPSTLSPTTTLSHESAAVDAAPSSSTSEAAVMCCYYKQQGWCKMGERCWYPHHGSESTPCHYGVGCHAGHGHLTTAAPLAPIRNGNEKRRDGIRTAVSCPCQYCGAAPSSVIVRRIPVWNDAGQCTLCARASCGMCGYSYLL